MLESRFSHLLVEKTFQPLSAVLSSLTEVENILLVSELLGAIYEIMYMAFCSMLIAISKIDTTAFIYKTL